MSLGLILVIVLDILLGGFSGRFRAYGFGQGGIGVILIVVVLMLLRRL
ncbi:DUF3309 family protein [Bradyrhizobium sp.]